MISVRNSMAALLAIIASPALADQPVEGPEQPTESRSLIDYINPANYVTLSDGREIHMVCMGSGSPTVILSAGLGEWSANWVGIQSELAKSARVCAWDRPGSGLSGPDPQPMSVERSAETLKDALEASGAAGPYVLVGHSLGGLESILLNDSIPDRVAGMVLIDPTVPDQTNIMKTTAPAVSEFLSQFYLDVVSGQLRHCANGLRDGSISWPVDGEHPCSLGRSGYPGEVVEALESRASDPAQWETSLSLIDSLFSDGIEGVRPERSFGSKPVIVLSATLAQELPPGIPSEVNEQMPRMKDQMIAEHRSLAALSSKGEQISVAASHYIHLDAPEAVLAAIKQVLSSLQTD